MKCNVTPPTRTWALPFRVLIVLWLIGGNTSSTRAAAEEKDVKNPLAAKPEAIREGQSLFRTNCGLCYGVDARGGTRGPDLTSGHWTHGSSDDAIFRTITKGVPGTQMPPNDLTEEETWMTLAYLRSQQPSSRQAVAGSRETGEKIFFRQGSCAQCHMVNGKGGRLGPDLTRIGASRPISYLVEAIREPNKRLAEGIGEPGRDYLDFFRVYETVAVVTKDGRRVTGVLKNEDNFSIQLMDQQEQFHLLLKKNLQGIIHERKSLMPAYDEQRLNSEQLQDLLAYLDSLRGK